MKFQIITRQFVKQMIKECEKDPDYARTELAISELIKKFPNNTELSEIVWKVSLINDLYHANMWSTFVMAEHIHSLSIDSLIMPGSVESEEIVNRIAALRIGSSTRYCYSFATKYCSWHNQLAYPMFDSAVREVLGTYKRKDNFDKFNLNDLKDYTKFKPVMRRFKDNYNLEGLDYKQIDKFLWWYGRKLLKQK